MDFFAKIILHFKKVKVVLVTGKGRVYSSEVIQQVFNHHFKVKKFTGKTPNILEILTNEIFVIETDLKDQKFSKKIKNLTRLSQLPILVVTHIGEIPDNFDFFSGDEKEVIEIREFAKTIPAYGFLILNFDDKTVRKIDNATNLKSFTFGFQEGADFRASDVHTNTGTNFKINYKGNIIPIWQEGCIGKEYIYGALAASCVGTILDLNFVEISEALKHCKVKLNKVE